MTRPGALYQRELPDGREVCVYPMLFTTRLCVGQPDDGCYEDAWCYERAGLALVAATAWDGRGDPPDGWNRHIGSGRRRPGGDPALEHVAP